MSLRRIGGVKGQKSKNQNAYPFELVQDGQHIAEGLAAAGLSHAHHRASFQLGRDRRSLDFGRLLQPLLGEGREQRGKE